ncbi:MAG: hypothetical protein Q7S06_00025 [Nanoarchaeota archaeon]|nr:hypothetical protein [Nanoarchaeota archaeon]
MERGKRDLQLLLGFFIALFIITLISAAAIGEDLHLNIQTTNSTGSVVIGTFRFDFNISTTPNCNNIVYTNHSSLTTDSRGIVSYYLENVVLNFSEQYYLCYYRDGTLINASKIARTPYTYRARNITLSGVEIDSDLNMGGYNATFNGGWQNGGVSIMGGSIFAQILHVYNISSLVVTHLNVNGSMIPAFDNIFDLGSSVYRWRDLYLSGQISSNGTGNNYFLGNLGIGTASPANELNVIGGINATGTLTSGVLTTAACDVKSYSNGTLYCGSDATLGGGAVIGSGDNGFIARWNGTNSLNNSAIFQLGNNVGIGTTSPTYRLDVKGNVSLNDSLYVVNSGNVGIGTTSPTQKVDVVGSANISNDLWVNGLNMSAFLGLLSANDTAINNTAGLVYGINTTANIGVLYNATASMIANTTFKQNFTLATIQSFLNNTNVYFSSLMITKGTGINEVNLSGVLYVNSTSGRVGIGTVSPNTTLDLRGNLSISGKLHNLLGGYIEGGGMNVMTMASSTGESNVGWTPRAGLEINSSNEITFSGNSSLKIISTSGADQFQFGINDGTLLQNDTEDDFVTTAWVYLPTAGGLTSVYLQYRDGGSTFYIGGTAYNSNTITALDSWQRIVLPFKATNTSGSGWLYFWAQGANNSDYMYVDNVQIQRGTIPTEFSPLACSPSGNCVLLDGKIGIGTASPTQALHIVGSTNISNDLWVNGVNISAFEGLLSANDTAINTTASLVYGINTTANIQNLLNGTGIYANYNNSDLWNRSGTNIFPRYIGDNVGIGTTNPSSLLTVQGDGTSAWVLNVSGGGIAVQRSSADSFITLYRDNYPAGQVRTLGNDSIGFANSAGTHKLIVNTSTGNVGIGTTNPTGKLEINNNAANALRIVRGANAISSIEFNNTAGEMNLGIDASGNLAIRNSDDIGTSPYLIINRTSGRVGIGTGVPTQKLDVSGSANISNDLWVNGVNITANLESSTNYSSATFNMSNATWDNSWINPFNNTWYNHTSATIGILSSNFTQLLSINTTANIQNLLNGTGIYNQGGTGGAFPIWINDSYQTLLNLSYPKFVNLSGVLYVNGTSGNVGIGIFNSSNKLEIFGGDTTTASMRVHSATYPTIEFYSDSADVNNRNWRLVNNYNAYGNFEILSSTIAGGVPTVNRLTINNLGYIGIGTANPIDKLQIEGSDSTALAMFINNTYTGAGARASLELKTSYSPKLWQMFTRNGDFFIGVDNVGDYMTIQNTTGNVGINTTNPSRKLEVGGELEFGTSGEISIVFWTASAAGSCDSVCSATEPLNVDVDSGSCVSSWVGTTYVRQACSAGSDGVCLCSGVSTA